MEANGVRAILEYLGPAIVICSIGASLAVISFVGKHFKLRARELELEAPLHAREVDARLRAMETRQAALEAAVGALVSSLTAIAGQRAEAMPPALAEPPPGELEAPRLVAVEQPPRQRR